jgi:predicted transcriptional regulator of viral defense system
MDINYILPKSMSSKSASFISKMYDDRKSIFTTREALKILSLEAKPLQKFLNPLLKKGIINRIIPGLYTIVPFEIGASKEYMPNPYIVAREIVRMKLSDSPFYIAFGSAMEIHQMVTQPQLAVYTVVPKQIKQKINVTGTEFKFVTVKENAIFGFKKSWVDKSEMIYVSDLEKTVIDGLKIPLYCGGILEVAKGLWMKRSDVNPLRLLDYAKKTNSGAVFRRLGFVLELLKINCPEVISILQEELTAEYQLLDPSLLKEGKYNSRWKLRLNISEDELLSALRT